MLDALWRRVPGSVQETLSEWVIALTHFRGPRFASLVRQRMAKIRNPRADITFGYGCYLGPGFSLHAPWGGRIHVARRCEFRRGVRIDLMGPDSVLEVGEGTTFTYNAAVQCGTTIRIGRGATFAMGTLLVDGSHRFRDLTQPAVGQGYDFRPIEIGDDVMVMAKATVIASVRERAFVGANAVVAEEVPAYTVAVGVPARVIDYFGPEGQEPEGWVSSER